MNRRHFIRRSALLAAAAGLPAWYLNELSAATPPKMLPLDERPGVALIGCGGRGREIARQARTFGDIRALCDLDSRRMEAAAATFPEAKRFSDFRKVLDQPDIHVVLNGTPDHWHTLVNLAAVQSARDVYSEKPLTLTIDEGKRLVAAVAENKRVFQTGSQQRSDPRFRLACELVRNGRIGKLQRVRTWLPAGPVTGPFASAPIPDELDWERYQGQAPAHDYVPQRAHSTFRYWLDYSGGTLTDWGAHHNDIALWALGMDRSGPVSVEGKVLRPPVPGGYDAPGEYRIEYSYANGVKHLCESVTANKIDGSRNPEASANAQSHGVRFEGSDGWIFVTRGRIDAHKISVLEDPLTRRDERLYFSADHMGNFFDCLRTRKAPICDAEIGHRSASLCHLGNISMRLGRALKWDPAGEQFIEDAAADQLLVREMRKPYDYSYLS